MSTYTIARQCPLKENLMRLRLFKQVIFLRHHKGVKFIPAKVKPIQLSVLEKKPARLVGLREASQGSATIRAIERLELALYLRWSYNGLVRGLGRYREVTDGQD